VGGVRRPASVLSRTDSEEANGDARPRRRRMRNELALRYRRLEPPVRALNKEDEEDSYRDSTALVNSYRRLIRYATVRRHPPTDGDEQLVVRSVCPAQRGHHMTDFWSVGPTRAVLCLRALGFTPREAERLVALRMRYERGGFREVPETSQQQKRLRFARWLVRHGHLTEWPAAGHVTAPRTSA